MTSRLDDLSDAELLERAREGGKTAFGVLFKRHWSAGRAMAASITGRFDPDDLASEAFTRILRAVEKGRGPKGGFRPYLATTIRNVAIDWSRRKSTPNIEDADTIEDWTYSELTALDRIERETMAKAFYALPDSWQEVLWYTEVEDMAPREVAPILGLKANAVSALAIRAREGLRQSWINAHLADVPDDDPEHAWVLSKLGSQVRGKLSRTDRAKVTEHLEVCASCSEAAEEAGRVGSRLALGIVPLLLGIPGAGAYLAWTSGRSASAVAATLPAADKTVALTRQGGRLRHLFGLGSSASNAGVAAVAATVAAAAVTTGAVMGAPLTSMAEAGPSGASSSASPDPEVSDPTDGPSQPPRGVAAGPSRSIDVPSPQPPSPQPAPPEARVPAPAPTEPAPPQVEQTPPSVEQTPPSVNPEPPLRPEPPAAACEAAVQTVPAASTLFAYRLDDPSGSPAAVDFVHGSTARYSGSIGDPEWSLADESLREPSDEFTVQIRFKTTVGGGRLIGFSSDAEGLSAKYDRHLFLTDDGRVTFGVFPATVHTISSPLGYADGRWHQATASLSTAGMSLYVDGELVARDASVTEAEQFSGHWRVGYDNLQSWGPATPANRQFDGSLSYAAVYSTALTPDQVRAQWALCG